MRAIIKVNPIQIRPFQGSQRLWVKRGVQKTYVGVREMKLGKRV